MRSGPARGESSLHSLYHDSCEHVYERYVRSGNGEVHGDSEQAYLADDRCAVFVFLGVRRRESNGKAGEELFALRCGLEVDAAAVWRLDGVLYPSESGGCEAEAWQQRFAAALETVRFWDMEVMSRMAGNEAQFVTKEYRETSRFICNLVFG